MYPYTEIAYKSTTYPNSALYRQLYPYANIEGNKLVNYEIDRDIHRAFTGATYTAPSSGYYSVTIGYQTTYHTLAGFDVNGMAYTRCYGHKGYNYSQTVNLNKGDKLKIVAQTPVDVDITRLK